MTKADANLEIVLELEHANKNSKSVSQERIVSTCFSRNCQTMIIYTRKSILDIEKVHYIILIFITEKENVSTQVMCVNKALLFHEYKSYKII